VRNGSEDGIPPFVPLRVVNDAPSAFAGNTLKVIAPVSWPAGLPIPLAASLRGNSGEIVRLNGAVTFGGFPQNTLQLRRGWGSIVLPSATNAGPLQVDAAVNGLSQNPSINIEASPSFSTAGGVIASNTNWNANSRMHVTSTLTINAGATLTVGAGTIVTVAPGVEIIVNGTLQVNGADGQPLSSLRTRPAIFGAESRCPPRLRRSSPNTRSLPVQGRTRPGLARIAATHPTGMNKRFSFCPEAAPERQSERSSIDGLLLLQSARPADEQ
jgi:hypothetical protein